MSHTLDLFHTLPALALWLKTSCLHQTPPPLRLIHCRSSSVWACSGCCGAPAGGSRSLQTVCAPAAPGESGYTEPGEGRRTRLANKQCHLTHLWIFLSERGAAAGQFKPEKHMQIQILSSDRLPSSSDHPNDHSWFHPPSHSFNEPWDTQVHFL